MKLAFITPTSYLERFATQGDIYLALAHLIDDEGNNEYARFHRREAEKGRRVILDNGLFEGAQVSTDALLQRARAIKASVVCAPDVLYDSARTIKEFKSFIKAKQEFGLVCDVMGIPQADNPAEWWDCFRFMELSDNCHIIGLSILSVPQSFEKLARGTRGKSFQRITDSRMYLIRELFSYKKLLGRPLKSCHLLGLGESLSDLTYASRLLPSIVSNDSSSAFVHGAAGIKYGSLGTWAGGKIHTPLDFELPYSSEINEEGVQHNINTAKKLVRGWGSQYNPVPPLTRH